MFAGNCNHSQFDDAENVIVSKLFTKDQAKKLWPMYKSKIKNASGEEDWNAPATQRADEGEVPFPEDVGRVNNKELVVYEPSDEEKAISLYAEAVEALKKGDAFYAGKKFKDVEDLMPQTDWAAKASLMSSYSEYSRNSYSN